MNAVRLFVLVFIFFVNSQIVSAATIKPGDLIITEVMANPSSVSDAYGEWFELHNLTGNSLNLDGLILTDNGTNKHTIDNGGSLIIDPFGYLVLGRNADPQQNGGYLPDYKYNNFNLTNDTDAIYIFSAGVVIVSLEYFDGFVVAGKSQELSGIVGFPLNGSNYVSSITPFGDGDLGTPGKAGNSSWRLSVQAVPVPPAIWLFGSVILGFMGLRKKRPAFSRP